MSRSIRLRFSLAAVLALGLAASALAQDAPKPAVDGGLRGPIAPPRPIQRTPDPALDPGALADTARGVDRTIGDQALGGADCRTNCAQTYYMCLAVEDADQCSPRWARCTAGCPSNSSNF
jgi:hypothetical protein